MQTKRQARLGAIPTAGRPQLEKEEKLIELEKYMTYEKRYSKYNVRCHLQRMRYILSNYEIQLVPCQEDAIRIEEDLKARNVQSPTIRHYLRALELMAECQGFKLKLKKPKSVVKVYDIPSIAEVRAMQGSCKNLRDLAILNVLLYTGIRNKELRALELADVDLKKKLLYVRDHGQDIKNRNERPEVMTSECVKAVEAWMQARDPAAPTKALFISEHGKPLQKDRLTRIIREIKEAAGIEKRVYPHLLRHTCGTIMLRSGIPIPDVAKQLGHKSLTSTMRYLHSDIESLKEGVDKKFRY